MKKLLIGFIFILIAMTGFSQETKQKFFQPLNDDLFKVKYYSGITGQPTGLWLLRPRAFVTAVQLNYNKETKKLISSALNQAGLGVSYAHYIPVNDKPYNNFSVNALLLLGADIEQPEPATVSIAVTGSFLEWVNIGGLYNFTGKSFGILTGVSISF